MCITYVTTCILYNILFTILYYLYRANAIPESSGPLLVDLINIGDKQIKVRIITTYSIYIYMLMSIIYYTCIYNLHMLIYFIHIILYTNIKLYTLLYTLTKLYTCIYYIQDIFATYERTKGLSQLIDSLKAVPLKSGGISANTPTISVIYMHSSYFYSSRIRNMHVYLSFIYLYDTYFMYSFMM